MFRKCPNRFCFITQKLFRLLKYQTIRGLLAVQQHKRLPCCCARKNDNPKCWWWWRIPFNRRKTSADVLFPICSTVAGFRVHLFWKEFPAICSLTEEHLNELEYGIECDWSPSSRLDLLPRWIASFEMERIDMNPFAHEMHWKTWVFISSTMKCICLLIAISFILLEFNWLINPYPILITILKKKIHFEVIIRCFVHRILNSIISKITKKKKNHQFQLTVCYAIYLEYCLLSNDIYNYRIVSQGKTTIPSVDDGEGFEETDVRIGPYFVWNVFSPIKMFFFLSLFRRLSKCLKQ